MKTVQYEINEMKKNYPIIQKWQDEYIFSLVFANYFYYDGDISLRHIDEIHVDGTNDGGIDLIFNDEESETNQLMLVQSKYSEKISNEEVIAALKKLITTSKMLKKNNDSMFNQKLKTTFNNAISNTIDDDMGFVFITSTIFSENSKKKLEKMIKSDDELSEHFDNIHIHDLDDINKRISLVNSEEASVKSGSLVIDDKNNFLEFPVKNDMYDEEFEIEGIIVNISAQSLKKIYHQHHANGLFDLNLRKYIKNKKVDSGIKESLQSERNNFWYLNNGITIGCSDYKIDGNELKLEDFSIINGAQTTTLISTADKSDKEMEDFFLPAKIIRTCSDDDFILKVSEASNSQKPIKPSDLKANAPEQRNLKKALYYSKPNVFMEIKRGVDSEKKNSVAKEFRRNNSEIGQLIISCVYQQPGTARSDRSKLFTNEEIYKKVFKKSHNTELIVDLVILENYYNTFLDKLSEEKMNTDQKVIAKNGKFTVLALLTDIINIRKMGLKYSQIKSRDEINLLDSHILRDYKADDIERKMFDLFHMLTRQLSIEYERRYRSEEFTSQSNFFKTDATYQKIINPYIMQIVFDSLEKEDYEKRLDIFDV